MGTSTKSGKITSLLAGAAFAFGMASAHAALTTVSPFAGDLSESWESFPNYRAADPNVVTPLANPTDIMGGAAAIASPLMIVYEPAAASAGFGLGSSGLAQVADGVKGMGLDSSQQVATITFDNAQTSFGAFWGAATNDSAGTTVNVLFLDANGNQVGADSFSYDRDPPADGLLEWHGWNSDVAFKSIIYAGNFVVIDSLQASGPNNGNPNPTPEPGSLALAGLALVALVGALRRKSRQ